MAASNRFRQLLRVLFLLFSAIKTLTAALEGFIPPVQCHQNANGLPLRVLILLFSAIKMLPAALEGSIPAVQCHQKSRDPDFSAGFLSAYRI
ncbi:hypothetical protein [Metabacillus indicus]|uniref:hypothetical protein n=1 Tax=Metabacillus indicus TaxID=246786 RepID=UPI000A6D4ACA|nr:hypothetical protein [Metabacillus indicus]